MNPTNNVFPVLRYTDPVAALRWLEQAFDFRVAFSVPGPDGGIAHAEVATGPGGGRVLVSGSAPGDEPAAADPQAVRQLIYVQVAEVAEHARRAEAAGAEITRPVSRMDYGATEYAARDLEGNHWSFGTYLPGA
jgi:uncharacterized glyoxalase superfamily protein PhnB